MQHVTFIDPTVPRGYRSCWWRAVGKWGW